MAMLVAVVAGCSFIGARIPAQPEPDYHCPTGVVIADGIGASVFLFPPVMCSIDGAINGFSGEYDGVACFVIGVPMAIIGSIYLASTIYGVRQSRRCERRKEAYVEQAESQQKRGAETRVRAPAVGDAPMVCAITEPDVGLCFADETTCKTEVERGGGACEPRTVAWCFDVQSIVGGSPESTCAVSRLDCDARRTLYTRDHSLVVTTCGTYQQRLPPPEAPIPTE